MQRPLVSLALALSGAAALANQVVWQRGLKVFLGGSEELASMVVVLVFMGGLGAGARLAAHRAPRLTRPLRTLALLELGIAGGALAVRALLASGWETSLRPLQTAAAAAGLPLTATYALGATLILLPPCLLMGATLPVSAEAVQRGLGLHDPGVIAALFFVNTLGSAGGALFTGGWALFHWGLQATMLAAVLANLVAAALLFILAATTSPAPPSPAESSPAPPPAPAAPPNLAPRRLAFLLGLGGLGYEMVLLRMFALRHEPLPYTFAAVITGFLLAWSVGVKSSESPARRLGLSRTLGWLALSLAIVPGLYLLRFPYDALGVLNVPLDVLAKALFFLPCALFGHAFGQLVARPAASWGEHVGDLSMWNTAGSCLGIVGMTLVGFSLDILLTPLVLAGLVAAGGPDRAHRAAGVALALGAAAVGASVDVSGKLDGARYYFGHDGVIAVFPEGDILWDGLWHSTFPEDRADCVGSNNWLRGAAPVLAHPTGDIRRVCIIGMGAGITASVLTGLDTVEQVVAYDITRTLIPVLRDHPAGSLGVLDNPRVEVRWEDGRMGLALRPDERFDVIVTHPLHLRQAGSSLLNSVEYLRLLRSRLAPGGVVCLFSGGTPAQNLVLRQTAAAVFPHRAAFHGGYVLVLGENPLGLEVSSLTRRLAAGRGVLWDELRAHRTLGDPAKVVEEVTGAPLSWGDGGLVVTDDRPILEYPGPLASEVARLHLGNHEGRAPQRSASPSPSRSAATSSRR